jgi:hypothetical protein
MLGGDSVMVPPESIPNSEVKRYCADGTVGSPHGRVGHRQATPLFFLSLPLYLFTSFFPLFLIPLLHSC